MPKLPSHLAPSLIVLVPPLNHLTNLANLAEPEDSWPLETPPS